MFGHDKDEDKKDDDLTVQPMSTQPVNHGLLGIDDDDSTTQSSDTSVSDSSNPGAPPTLDTPVANDSPSDNSLASSDPDPATPPVEEPASADTPDLSAPAQTVGNDDDLLNIKRAALEELSPLIDHLEQDAEEKFRTTMMMIQASDNKSLVPQAFEAAKGIQDNTKRAQALLDIVNEINYFTQKHND